MLTYQDCRITPTNSSGIADNSSMATACYNIGSKLYDVCSSLSERLKGLTQKALPPKLSKAQQEHIQSLLDMLQETNKPPVSKPYGFTDNSIHYRLLLPEGRVYKDNKEARAIECWIDQQGYTLNMKKDTNTPKIRFVVTYKDLEKRAYKLPLMFPIEGGIDFILRTDKVFTAAGAFVQAAFLHQSQRPIVDWAKQQVATDPLTNIFYKASRSGVPAGFDGWLNTHPAYIEKANQCGLQLFSFGCGDGEDIKALQKLFKLKCSRIPEAFGVDINPGYFPKQHEGVQFVQQDMLQMEPWLQKTASKIALKVGLFMGSLTSQVAQSSYAALKCLHAARDFDILYVGGYTPVLLTEAHMNDAGWTVTTISTNSYLDPDPASRIIEKVKGVIRPDIRNHHMLTPMNNDQRKVYLETKSTLRVSSGNFTLLDLSGSSKPLADLALFDRTFTLVDISWCNFNTETFAQFIEQLEKKTAAAATLIASGDEPWIIQFMASQTKFTLKLRQDHKKDELAPFAPATAKLLGIYDREPLKACLK